MALAQFQPQIAALGDFNGVLKYLGHIGKQRRHFLLGLEILLGTETFGSALIRQYVTFGYAHPRFVRTKILTLEKLYRVCGNRRQTQRTRERQRTLDMMFHRDDRGTAGHRLRAQALHFQIITAREQCRPFLRQPLRGLLIAGHKRLANVAMMGPGKSDQAVGACFVDPGFQHFRAPAVLIAAISPRQQLAQAQVSIVVLRQ